MFSFALKRYSVMGCLRRGPGCQSHMGESVRSPLIRRDVVEEENPQPHYQTWCFQIEKKRHITIRCCCTSMQHFIFPYLHAHIEHSASGSSMNLWRKGLRQRFCLLTHNLLWVVLRYHGSIQDIGHCDLSITGPFLVSSFNVFDLVKFAYSEMWKKIIKVHPFGLIVKAHLPTISCV